MSYWRQREYFDHGPQHLKPLPMIEVADQLGIHVGTVSRAVSDKWMQTPRGLVALRKFFSGGTATHGGTGESMSWDAVKATLKEIVEGEDKSHPMSDEALVEELQKKGIEIAEANGGEISPAVGYPACSGAESCIRNARRSQDCAMKQPIILLLCISLELEMIAKAGRTLFRRMCFGSIHWTDDGPGAGSSRGAGGGGASRFSGALHRFALCAHEDSASPGSG